MENTKEEPKTRFEQFKANAHADWDAYLKRIKEIEIREFVEVVDSLQKLQNKINGPMLVYLFGEQLGTHLAEKFLKHNRNLLSLLSALSSEYRFFLLHELKTNEYLFVNC